MTNILQVIKRDYEKCVNTPGDYTTIPMEWYKEIVSAINRLETAERERDEAVKELNQERSGREAKSEMNAVNP